MPQGDAVIVFGKRPIAGRVKTRLLTLLTPAEAAQLSHAFLIDSVQQYVSLPADVFLYLGGDSQEEDGVDRLSDVDVRSQRGDDLAERMRNSFLDMFASGYERVVIIGTDHPSLPLSFVEQAFEALERPMSIVVGPTEDGGYYLLGMNDFYPILFHEMIFSHEKVFEDTLDRAATTSAALAVLPTWYDVDTPDQLTRLEKDLLARPEHAPRTVDVLRTLSRRYDWT